jgi:SAM-dependent methyltransferase
MRAPPELLIAPLRPGELLVTNPSTRTHAVGDPAFAGLLTDPDGAAQPTEFHVVDATVPSFRDGLLGDPTGVDREATLDGAEALDRDGALELAKRLMLVVEDEQAYEEFLRGRRLNVIDRKHRGNLHQRVGEYVMFGLRQRSVDDWWADQKFADDRREPRAGLYLDVQWRWATEYYARAGLERQRILDFGCGPGLFARLFASHGASVVGLDTNLAHIDTARRLAEDDGLGDRCRFAELELPPETGLDALGDERFDRIFLSDVLMFYFHPYDPSLELDPASLLERLRALLAPGGCIEVLEPNGVFWQQLWLGSAERPLTVLTEYRHRTYGVTPTLEAMAGAAEQAHLAITRVREPAAEPKAGDRATGFAAEFPPWWFFELRPRG